jgi:hypothetical protein
VIANYISSMTTSTSLTMLSAAAMASTLFGTTVLPPLDLIIKSCWGNPEFCI